jgi:hypothetical protein
LGWSTACRLANIQGMMATRLLLSFSLIFLVPLARSHAGTACTEKPKPVSRATKEQFAKLRAWREKKKLVEKNSEDKLSEADFIYVVDANNDGIKDWLLPTYGGSGSYLDYDSFVEAGSGFKSAPSIPDPSNDVRSGGPWMLVGTADEAGSNADAGFLTACGKIYYNLDQVDASSRRTDWDSVYREVVLWEKKKSKLVTCEPYWLAYLREEGTRLFENKEVRGRALRHFEALISNCESRASREDIGWLRNDLAFLQYKAGERANCAETVKELKKSKGFGKLSAKLGSAAAHNEKLCRPEPAKEIRRRQLARDYSWLAKLDGQPIEKAFGNPRWNDVLDLIVPQVAPTYGDEVPGPSAQGGAEVRARVRSIAEKGYGGKIAVVGGRYVWISGCEGNAGLGMIWVDLQARGGVVGYEDGPVGFYDVYTRSLLKKELPKDWVERFHARCPGQEPSTVSFFTELDPDADEGAGYLK